MLMTVAEIGSILLIMDAFEAGVCFSPDVYRKNGSTVPIIAVKRIYFTEGRFSAIIRKV